MYRIPQHIYFERRRLTLAGVLAFAAGYALYAHIHATVFGLPFPVFTGLFYAVVVMFAAAVTSYFLPNLRKLIDSVAVARLGFAIWVVSVHGQDIAASPLARATVVVGGAIFLLRLGSWIDTFSRTPSAPLLFVNIAARARVAVAWLDNTAVRGSASYPVSIGRRASVASVQNNLAAA